MCSSDLQNFVVENRPGAGSIVGTDVVAKAQPDGYTLLMVAASFTITPAVYKELPFDSVRDFSPVTQVSAFPNILVVPKAFPAWVRTLEMTYSAVFRDFHVHLHVLLLPDRTKYFRRNSSEYLKTSDFADEWARATEVPGSRDTTQVVVEARGLQKAMAKSNALAVSTGISVGTSLAKTVDSGSITAEIGDDARVTAAVLRARAVGQDDTYQRASASSGGLISAVGADTKLAILATTLVRMGDRGIHNVGLLDLNATRTQNFDATSKNLAVGIFAGSGAAMSTVMANAISACRCQPMCNCQ